MSSKKSVIKNEGGNNLTLHAEFFGGIVRDDKSEVPGAGLAVEELDILENENFVRPTHVFSADTIPANMEVGSYSEDAIGTGYGVGNLSGFASVMTKSNIGTPGAGAWTTQSTSGTLAANNNFPSAIHYEVELGAATATPTIALYFIGSSNHLLKWTAAGGVVDSGFVLSSITSNSAHVSMRDIQGTLYIAAGNFISTIDVGSQAGGPNFNEAAFTLPFGNQAVDIVEAGEYFFVGASFTDLISTQSTIYIWDGVSGSYTDLVPVPMGGLQWLYNFRQSITLCCCENGKMKLFYLNAPTTGALCKPYPNIELGNVQVEGQNLLIGGYALPAPVSPTHSVFAKDDQLYFGLWKTDKSGLYALGQIDANHSFALWLAKRYATTNYAYHYPMGARGYGPKIFAAYGYTITGAGSLVNNAVVCDPATANRSSQALLQSVWEDDGQPFNNKVLQALFAESYPMPIGCSLDLYYAADYSTTFTQLKQASNVIMNIVNAIFAIFHPTGSTNKKLYQWQVLFTSRNLVSTTLAAAITSTAQTTVTVTSGTGINNGDIITVDTVATGQEKMLVISGGGTANLVVQRAVSGTYAVTHSNGVIVNNLSVAPKLTAVGMRKIIKPLDA